MTRKTYFTISEIAKEFKVKKSQIRSYEKKGLISPANNKLGRRSYTQFNRARLELIFHFEHIDYSPDQLSELIGILDANLNEMEQLRKSLEYGEKKLHELEQQSKNIKFPNRISMINEINMMDDYIEALKNIASLNSVIEKKPEQKHIRMILVYAGLSIIILFSAAYFFNQGGTMLNLTQKKPSEAEASPVFHYPVPSEDTSNPQNVAPQSTETPDSHARIQGDRLI
jgi:DNA-binding transcriptional MerR regulator